MEQRESDIKIYVPRYQSGGEGHDLSVQRAEDPQPEPSPDTKPGDLPPEIICKASV